MPFRRVCLLACPVVLLAADGAQAQVASAPVSPVQSEALSSAAGVDEYDRVPVGLLAAPEKPQGDPSAAKSAPPPASASQPLPGSLGQIPGVYQIPGVALQQAAEGLTVDDIKVLYRKGEMAEAFRHLEPLAAAGNHDAEELAGIMLLQGQGVAADPAKALQFLIRAAEANKLLAQHYAGNALFKGLGVEMPDPIQALTWLEIAWARYPVGPHKARAHQDRDLVAASLTRLERERAKEAARKFLEARDEAHLLEIGQ